jgi:nucleoid-associated protein YgaU
MVEVVTRSEPPTMQRVEDVPAPAPPVPAAPAAPMWTVEPGDHLWNVAERVWAEAHGHVPTAAQVAPYWRQLVEANRATLADPENPDLVFPGQTLTLPNVPA